MDRATAIGLVCLSIALGLTQASLGLDPLTFRAHLISSESEFTAAAALDVNGRWTTGHCVGWAGGMKPLLGLCHKLREVERIGTRFDDYSNH